MAKFLPGQKYYVPRTKVGTPVPIPELVELLFPRVVRWREQYEGVGGDPGAKMFLCEILPYLAEVCAQDGIYWVVDHPTHFVSTWLVQKIPGYLASARAKRQECVTAANNYEAEKISKLNDAAQAAFNSMVRRIEGLETQVVSRFDASDRLFKHFQDQLIGHARQQQLIVTQLNTMVSQNNNILDILRSRFDTNTSTGTNVTTGTAPPAADTTVLAAVPLLPAAALRPAVPVPQIAEPLRYRNRLLVPAAVGLNGRPPANALNRLGTNQCSFSNPLPESMAQVLVEHDQFDLPSFAKKTARKGWASAKEISYSKRCYLYGRIVKRHGVLARVEGRNRMRDAALGFDQERGSLTVPAFYNKLKAADNTVKKRKPRVVAAVDGCEDSDFEEEDEMVVVPAIETAAAKRMRLNIERGVETAAAQRRRLNGGGSTAAAQHCSSHSIAKAMWIHARA
eukprot:scaffold12145_cov61-Attheya_sp.AAC.1